jgi:hypothetical protein
MTRFRVGEGSNANTLSSTMSTRRGTALRQNSRRNTGTSADNMALFMQQVNETAEENLRRELSTAQKENDRVSLRVCPAFKVPLTFLRCINTTNASFPVVARPSPLTANPSCTKTPVGAISGPGTRIQESRTTITGNNARKRARYARP